MGFENVADFRQYRLAVCSSEGTAEFRFRIAITAFAGRVRLQDGPDVCYQWLLRAIAAGETAAGPDVITIDDDELARYREAHTHAGKRRATPPPATPRAPFVPRPQRSALPAQAAPVAPKEVESGVGTGRRVRHATYGLGVTGATDDHHTVVCFDEAGSKTFVTALLRIDLLSAPNTWETGPRGKNRPRDVASTS
jgi:hypothetical protein